MENMKYKEISKKDSRLYTVWDSERIRKAFNNGNGTVKDFSQYMKNNSKYAIFEKVEA